MVQAENDVEGLILQLSTLNPDQQLMMVSKDYIELDGRGWTVHYINESSSCALGEVEGKFVGRGRTLAAALRDCLDRYERGWTEGMEWDRQMAQPIDGADDEP